MDNPSVQQARDVQSSWDPARWLCPDAYGNPDIDPNTGVLTPASPFKNAATDGTDTVVVLVRRRRRRGE